MKARPYAAVGVFLLGAVLLTVGVMRGEMDIVLQKAVRICLECIGLG
jgi:hypothetical protein